MPSFLHQYWLVILKWAVIVGGAMAVIMRLISEGQKREKVKQIERTLENVKEAKRVENNVDNADSTELERLRKKWTRK